MIHSIFPFQLRNLGGSHSHSCTLEVSTETCDRYGNCEADRRSTSDRTVDASCDTELTCHILVYTEPPPPPPQPDLNRECEKQETDGLRIYAVIIRTLF